MQLSSDPVCLSLTVCDGQETVEYKLEDVCHSDGGCDCLPPIQRLSIRWLVVATFLSLIGPEKSKRWVALAVLVRLVTKLTSIVNHRNTQFSRPSRGGEFWKPVLLFGSTKVNNSFTP